MGRDFLLPEQGNGKREESNIKVRSFIRKDVQHFEWHTLFTKGYTRNARLKKSEERINSIH